MGGERSGEGAAAQEGRKEGSQRVSEVALDSAEKKSSRGGEREPLEQASQSQSGTAPRPRVKRRGRERRGPIPASSLQSPARAHLRRNSSKEEKSKFVAADAAARQCHAHLPTYRAGRPICGKVLLCFSM